MNELSDYRAKYKELPFIKSYVIIILHVIPFTFN